MTEVSISSYLSALESQAGTLNTLSDQVNSKLTDIESRIVKLNIGMEFWYSYPIHRDDSVGTFSLDSTSEQDVQVLGLAKVSGSWCLAVKPIKLVKGFYEGDYRAPFENRYAAGKVQPLLSASRDLRIAALAHMPEFLEKLSEHVREANEVIQKANAK